jgi:hypothetical protein
VIQFVNLSSPSAAVDVTNASLHFRFLVDDRTI